MKKLNEKQEDIERLSRKLLEEKKRIRKRTY